MWSVARRQGVSVAALTSASGRSADEPLRVGARLRLPPPSPSPGGNGRLPFSLWVPIHSPRGPAYLEPAAVPAWEAMRQASLRELGVDLYPYGPDSAYRSYGKQVEAWRLFKAGGPEAAAAGDLSARVGREVTPCQANVPVVLGGGGVMPDQYIFAGASGAVVIPGR